MEPVIQDLGRIGYDEALAVQRGTLDGETVLKCDPEIGYLHRGFEKECESSTWVQCFPYTDRLNYVSPLLNNFGYALAVEKMLGIKATDRGADFFTAVHGEAADLRNAQPHLDGVIARAYSRKGL